MSSTKCRSSSSMNLNIRKAKPGSKEVFGGSDEAEPVLYTSKSATTIERSTNETAPGIVSSVDETSVCSTCKTFPEHEFACPNQMPHLIPVEHIMCRKEQRQRRRARVKKAHQRIQRRERKEAILAIEEHARRVEERQRWSERVQRCKTWLPALVLARTVAWNLSRKLIVARKDSTAREALRRRIAERDHAVRVIQRAARNRIVYKKRHEYRDFWCRSALFEAKIHDARWIAALKVQCWRRRQAVKKIKRFLRENLCNRGAQAIAHFILKVRQIQKSALEWLVARRRRRKMLREMWNDVDAKMRRALEQRLKRDWNPLTPMPVVQRRRGLQVDLATRMPELVNKAIGKIANIEGGMDKLLARQRGVGVRGARGSRATTIRVEKLPLETRENVVDAILKDIVERNSVSWDDDKDGGDANDRTFKLTERPLQPRQFTSQDVTKILSLSSSKGAVRRVRDLLRNPRNSSRSPTTLIFFTAYRPRSLHEVVAERWIEAYNALHIPLDPETSCALLKAAEKDNNARRLLRKARSNKTRLPQIKTPSTSALAKMSPATAEHHTALPFIPVKR